MAEGVQLTKGAAKAFKQIVRNSKNGHFDTNNITKTPISGGTFAVQLEVAGGSAGSVGVRCSYTYDIYHICDNDHASPLATGVAMTGNGNRIVTGPMTAGTFGRAALGKDDDGNPVILLLSADEVHDEEACDS